MPPLLAADQSLAAFGMKQVSDQVLEMRRSAGHLLARRQNLGTQLGGSV
jgi:hypothetical protein